MSDPRPPSGPVRFSPLRELTRTRILEFFREKEALFWTFGFPVLLALALGSAFRSAPPEKPRLAVLGEAAAVRRVETLLGTEAHLESLSEKEAEKSLGKGKLDLLVLARTDPAGGPPRVTYRYDPTRGDSRYARLVTDNLLQRAAGRRDALPAGESPFTRPGSRYIDFLIPGLIGLNLMGSGMWGIGYAVVEARVNKLLKRYAATPMRRAHFLLAYILSRLVLLLPEMFALVGFGWLLFGVKVHGSLVDLAVVALATSFAFAGLGLLVAARPRTTEVVMGWMNLVMLPMWVFSGAFFSYVRFPESFHPFIRALPLTAANDAMRMIVNDGLPLTAAWSEMAVLAAWCAGGFLLALRWFRWQ